MEFKNVVLLAALLVFSYSASAHNAVVSFTPVNQPAGETISGYNVYRTKTSGTGYVKVNTNLVTNTSFTDSTVLGGTIYFYVVTAVDTSNVESTFSKEAKAVIPESAPSGLKSTVK